MENVRQLKQDDERYITMRDGGNDQFSTFHLRVVRQSIQTLFCQLAISDTTKIMEIPIISIVSIRKEVF